MYIAASTKVFLSWGDGKASLRTATGSRYIDHYVVFRGQRGDGSDAKSLGHTFSETFFDCAVKPATSYHYKVYAAHTKNTSSLRLITSFSVVTKKHMPANLVPPTSPVNLKAKGVGKAILWTWTPSSPSPGTTLLGYFIETSDSPQPYGFIHEKGRKSSWRESASLDKKHTYRLRAIDSNLNVSKPTKYVSGTPRVPSEDGFAGFSNFYEQILQTVEGKEVTAATAGRRTEPPNFTQYLDGPLAESLWSSPAQMKHDSHGNTFVADMFAGTIRKITPKEEIVSTIAGSPFEWGHVDAPGEYARFTYVYALGIDDDDSIYVGDSPNYCIRKLTLDGEDWIVTTLAGRPEIFGCQDGPLGLGTLDQPQGITYASNGNVYFTQYGDVVRCLTPNGILSTIAGSYNEAGYVDGVGTEARFNGISDIVCVRDKHPEEEYLLIADRNNNVIRKVLLTGETYTYCGVQAEAPADVDGLNFFARLAFPATLCLDSENTLWIGEAEGGLGWTVYTFLRGESAFALVPGATIIADVLLVGGGGSGGGGGYGGGGGGGGFIDKHDYEIKAGSNDGVIVVGEGGAEIWWDETEEEAMGKSSTFGELEAFGGGYGGRSGGIATYEPSDGASGGGGIGIHTGTEANPFVWGKAVHNIGDGPDLEQGHDGGTGNNTAPWGYNACGGGGGACWPANGSGEGRNGGLGRVCDIQGYGPYWTLGIRYIPWFGGGGAGSLRGVWGDMPGNAGYGGGGGCGEDGAPNTGGGGGGLSWFGNTSPGWYGDSPYLDMPQGFWHNKAPGKSGGSGIVVIRIKTSDKSLVQYPVSIGEDDEGNPIYPSGVHVTQLGEDQPHTDVMGDERVAIYAWPPDHMHTWGFSSWTPGI